MIVKRKSTMKIMHKKKILQEPDECKLFLHPSLSYTLKTTSKKKKKKTLSSPNTPIIYPFAIDAHSSSLVRILTSHYIISIFTRTRL